MCQVRTTETSWSWKLIPQRLQNSGELLPFQGELTFDSQKITQSNLETSQKIKKGIESIFTQNAKKISGSYEIKIMCFQVCYTAAEKSPKLGRVATLLSAVRLEQGVLCNETEALWSREFCGCLHRYLYLLCLLSTPTPLPITGIVSEMWIWVLWKLGWDQ